MNESTKNNDSNQITPNVDTMQGWLGKINTNTKSVDRFTKSNTDQMVVVFSADDGTQTDIDNLLPLFKSKTFSGEYPTGVPASLAIVGYLNGSTYNAFDAAGLRDLQDDFGWEIVCHSWTHDDLTTLTEAEVVTNLENCQEQFKSDGINVTSIYYPFGAQNDLSREVCSRYYRAGFGVGSGDASGSDLEPPVGETVIPQYAISRYPLDTKTLAEAKAHVDVMVSRGNGLCNFYMHSSTIAMSLADLGLLIDYVHSLGIPMLNTSDALDRMGNTITLGANTVLTAGVVDATQQNEPFFSLSTKGEVLHGPRTYGCNIEDPQGRGPDSLPTDFRPYARTVITFTQAEGDGFPGYGAGTLTTDRNRASITTLVMQTWQAQLSNQQWVRYSQSGDGAWNDWVRIDSQGSPSMIVYEPTLNLSGVVADTPITDFDIYRISYHGFNTAGASTAGFPQAGTLVTNRMIGNSAGFQWQEYQYYNSTRKDKRIWLSTGNWGPWVEVDPAT